MIAGECEIAVHARFCAVRVLSVFEHAVQSNGGFAFKTLPLGPLRSLAPPAAMHVSFLPLALLLATSVSLVSGGASLSADNRYGNREAQRTERTPRARLRGGLQGQRAWRQGPDHPFSQ